MNDADVYRAVLQRVVPGGQVWIVSTPWLADTGLLETSIAKNWGTHEHALVATAGTRALNPTWDPDQSIERHLREQDPDAAVREIDGEPMSGGAGTFFDATAISGAVDEELIVPGPPRRGEVVFAADLGFVSDSSVLVGISTKEPYDVVVLEELRPKKGAPLKPSEVIGAFVETLKLYGATSLVSDAHYRETVREHLKGIDFVDAPAGRNGKAEVFLHARKILHEKRARIPNHARLVTQLRQVVSKPAPGGGLIISSPRRRGAGHGDVASAYVLALFAARNEKPEWVTAMNAMRARGQTIDDYLLPKAPPPRCSLDRNFATGEFVLSTVAPPFQSARWSSRKPDAPLVLNPPNATPEFARHAESVRARN